MSEHEDHIDETAASDTIVAHNPSRSELMSMVNINLAAMPKPELMDFCAKALAFMNAPNQPTVGGDEANKSTITTKPSDASPGQPALPVIQTVREDLDTVLSAQDLPADAVEKLLTLFEAAVNARLAVEVARIEDEHEKALDEQTEELIDKLDQYIEYAAAEFFTENEVAIENSLKVDLYEEFVDGLQDLFRKHWVEIPEDRVDVAAELADRVAELEEELNARTQEVLDLEEMVLATSAARVFDSVSEGLTEADREKLRGLVETVEFDGDEEKLATRIKTIREAHFDKKSDKKSDKTLSEATKVSDGEGEVVTVTLAENGEAAPVVDDPAIAAMAAAIADYKKKRGV